VSAHTASHAKDDSSAAGGIQTRKSFDCERASWMASAGEAVVHSERGSAASAIAAGSEPSAVDMSMAWFWRLRPRDRRGDCNHGLGDVRFSHLMISLKFQPKDLITNHLQKLNPLNKIAYFILPPIL
jgi:hypothetical protein